jgi:hypothetical protein
MYSFTKKPMHQKVLSEAKDLQEQRYRIVGNLIGQVNAELKWADGKLVKETFDAAILKLIGPKTPEDSKPLVKKDAGEKKEGTSMSIHAWKIRCDL